MTAISAAFALLPVARYATALTAPAAAPIGPGMNAATSPTTATTFNTPRNDHCPSKSVQFTGGMAARFGIKPDGGLPRLDPYAVPAGGASGARAAGSAEYVAPAGAPTAWIVDVDGTLARMTGRSPFDWARAGEDEPIPALVSAVTALARDGHRIVVMLHQSRPCRGKEPQHRCLTQSSRTGMRPEGNTEQDALIKGRLFDGHVRERLAVVGVLDDRDQVVALWRSLGLPCFQVAPGAF